MAGIELASCLPHAVGLFGLPGVLADILQFVGRLERDYPASGQRSRS